MLASPRPDRFIPQRNALNVDLCHHLLTKENQEGPRTPPMYKDLAKSLLNSNDGNKILAFKQKAPLPKDSDQNELKVLYSCSTKTKKSKAKATRTIASQPELTLEAPNLVDDYYLNLLDWNCNNVLAIGLHHEVFLWNGNDERLLPSIVCLILLLKSLRLLGLLTGPTWRLVLMRTLFNFGMPEDLLALVL